MHKLLKIIFSLILMLSLWNIFNPPTIYGDDLRDNSIRTDRQEYQSITNVRISVTPTQSANPTILPQPTNPPNNISHISIPKINLRFKGSVALNANVNVCGNTSFYQGTFWACPEKISVIDTNSSSGYTEVDPQGNEKECYPVFTDSKGYGLRILPAGVYKMYSPGACLPGQYCVMDQAEVQVVRDGLSFTFDPSKFQITPGKKVGVKAVGNSSSMICAN